MKKRSILAFSLLTACGGLLVGACGDDSQGGPAPQAGVAGTGSPPGGAPSTAAGSGGAPAAQGGMSTAGTAVVAGTAGTESGGTGGTGPTCDVLFPNTFRQEPTPDPWDDNNFGTAEVSGVCPVLVDITWPHDPDWQYADRVDANHEKARLTLDSNGGDLTNKVIHLDIELTQDVRGPNATAGGYKVWLLSVSSFQKIVPLPPMAGTGGTDAVGGSAGTAGDSGGNGGLAGASGAGGSSAGTGGLATGGSAGVDQGGTGGTAPTTQTVTAYVEAESKGGFIFTRVGEKAHLSFPLPAKDPNDPESYDPASAIKINIRIESVFEEPMAEEPPQPPPPAAGGADGGGGAAGLGGASGGTAGLGGGGGLAGLGGASGGAGAGGAAAGSPGAAGAPTKPAPVYDYLTTQFAITNFTIADK